MIREWIMNHVFMSSILMCGAISLLLQAVMNLSLKGYVKASTNMQTTRKKNMLHLKNQFEAIHEMGSQVRNVGAYVDKYLLKLRLIGFSLSTWEKVPYLTAGVVTLIAGGELFYEYINGGVAEKQVEILFAYGAVLACLFVFYHIFGIKNKREQIQIQLVDYLENYMVNRFRRNPDGTDMSENPEADRMIALLKETGGMDLDKTLSETDAFCDDSDAEEDVARLKRILKEIDERNERLEEINHARTDVTNPAKTEMVAPVRFEATEAAGFDVSSLTKSSMEAASDLESVSEMADLLTEESDVELLEEFVQSFLS